MPEYSHPLGDAVKRARGKIGLTQNEVADLANVDVRTVLNIENYKGNPKMEVLYPLVRALKIDARDFQSRNTQRFPGAPTASHFDRGMYGGRSGSYHPCI